MSYEQDKTDSMLFNDPEDMTEHELGLALYHIGARTVVSRQFTQEFISKVTLRASQLLYSRIEWPEMPEMPDMSDMPFEQVILGDWSPCVLEELEELAPTYRYSIPIETRYPEFKDGKMSQMEKTIDRLSNWGEDRDDDEEETGHW